MSKSLLKGLLCPGGSFGDVGRSFGDVGGSFGNVGGSLGIGGCAAFTAAGGETGSGKNEYQRYGYKRFFHM